MRNAKISRKTKETDIEITLNIDGKEYAQERETYIFRDKETFWSKFYIEVTVVRQRLSNGFYYDVGGIFFNFDEDHPNLNSALHKIIIDSRRILETDYGYFNRQIKKLMGQIDYKDREKFLDSLNIKVKPRN